MGQAWGREGANGLWVTGQPILNMRPERREIHTLALKAPTKVKDFLHLRTHVNAVHHILLFNAGYIFVLCRLKINHLKEIQNLDLFLGLLII
jgi:hypothetical protein